jgi:hypothetical protein
MYNKTATESREGRPLGAAAPGSAPNGNNNTGDMSLIEMRVLMCLQRAACVTGEEVTATSNGHDIP